MPVEAMEVARCLIHLSQSEEEEDRLSPLRLQKLLYYCQSWSLALRDRPLFVESVHAWKHGPVVPPVYHAFKECGFGSIDPDRVPVSSSLSADDLGLIQAVWKAYRGFSAVSLSEMSHSESPWAAVVGDGVWGRTITHESMKRFFVGRAARNAKAKAKTA